MKFTLSSTALSNRLSSLAKVIVNKNSLQILECFLFEIKNGELRITASDSENVMSTKMALETYEGEGSFCVSNRTIMDAVRELPEQPLTFYIDLSNYNIEVTYLNGHYSFTGQTSESFPTMNPMGDGVTELVLNYKQFNAAIARSIFAAGQDELRPAMSGVLFDLNADGLSVVSTDGQKLVRSRILNVNKEEPTSFILPKKPATLLKNMTCKEDTQVVVKFDSRNAEITWADNELMCRLIEGRYPNYQAVIPTDNPNQITIDRKVLIGALRRVLPFANEATQVVRFRTDIGMLELSSEDIDFATSAKETIACDYNGRPMSIGFKGHSFAEILNNIEGNEVVIELADPSRAGVVLPAEQPENEHILMLILPVLLNN